ncbi:MAG TPA: hypothetical protein VLD35_08705 [Caldimonas sp.]|nr:hypothetical protein [Caldimonas sp.]
MALNVIQRQLGHANLGITSIYLQGIDNAEIIHTVYARSAPVLPASAGPTGLLNLIQSLGTGCADHLVAARARRGCRGSPLR